MMKKSIYTFILFSILLVVPSFQSFGAGHQSKSEIIHLNSLNYKKSISKGIVLVDFWASWCAPCRKMNPILEELAVEFKGMAKIAKIDADKFESFTTENKVQALPTIIVYKDGKEMQRLVGLQTKEDIKEVISKYLQKK